MILPHHIVHADDAPDPWASVGDMPADPRDRAAVLRACRARGVPYPAWARRHRDAIRRATPATMHDLARLRRDLRAVADAVAAMGGA